VQSAPRKGKTEVAFFHGFVYWEPLTSRRAVANPYFWELFSLVNLALIIVLFYDRQVILDTFPATLLSFGSLLAIETVVGVLIRCVIAAFRREFRAYWRIVSSPGWLIDTARMILVGCCMIHAYLWIKVVVPLLHARRFDQELWNLDRRIFFGMSPNILALDLFSNRQVLRFVDWSYVTIFGVSMVLGFVFFLSSPSRRIRMSFMSGMATMWLIGGWLYVLIPSVGPAYGFSDVWFAYTDALRVTQSVQGQLMRNYQNVMKLRTTVTQVDIRLGIAAFPSLHVGMQTFMLLWMRKLWTWGEIVFGIFLFIIFLGSLITGWHYLTDSIAGLLLAVICYSAVSRFNRINRWVELQQTLKGRA
jgi:hypothetical protein